MTYDVLLGTYDLWPTTYGLCVLMLVACYRFKKPNIGQDDFMNYLLNHFFKSEESEDLDKLNKKLKT